MCELLEIEQVLWVCALFNKLNITVKLLALLLHILVPD